MHISVFGLGYVGCVSAACLAADGHSIVGVDGNTTKVDLINAGRSPLIEKTMESLIARAVAAGRLRATANTRDAVASTKLSFVCVGTPSALNGSPDLQYLRCVSASIGRALK